MTAEACVRKAGGSFLLGKLNQCTAFLQSLTLIEDSVVYQWMKESNLVVCKEDSTEILLSQANSSSQARLDAIKSILQKIRGLPASRKLASLELALTYNYTVLAFESFDSGCEDGVDIMEKVALLEKELLLCLQRCIGSLDDEESCNNKLDIIELVSTMATESLPSDSVIPMTLLCCIVSIYHLMEGNTEKAFRRLEMVDKLEANSQQKEKRGISLLMKLPYQNLTVTLGNNESGASFQLTSFVHLLKALCLLNDEKYTSCLQLLQKAEKDVPSHLLFTWEYIKGYCLYQEGSFHEAAYGLHSLMTSSSTYWDAAMKARCNNLIGCCLAKQDRPNSAVQKFRESLQQDFSYLEPLYNVSFVYRQMGLNDAELESLNLLVTALANTEAEKDDSLPDVAASVKGVHLSMGAGHRDNINIIHALYALAKRCLEMHRYSAAAEKFMDLLAVLDERDVLLPIQSRHSPDGMLVLPRAEVIYLEAALALFKAGKSEDAIMLCDQILSKCSPPSACTAVSSRNQNDETSIRLQINSTESQDTSEKNIRGHLAGTSQGIVQEARVDDSELSGVTRKRQREEDNEEGGQSNETSTRSSADLGQTQLRYLHLYCSTLLLKSQCYSMTKHYSKVTNLLEKVLDLLKGVTGVDCAKDLTDVGCLSDNSASGPQLKKRRLDREEKVIHHENYTLTNEPMRSSLLEIKSQACSDKALVLIGQGSLQDAMKLLLRSLQCQPDNQDALYNYTLLLIKMGRRQDAVVALDRLKTTKGMCDSTIQKLEKALNAE